MKLAVASDIHLEFGPIELLNTEGAKVLILSGDICVAKDLQRPNNPYGVLDPSSRAEKIISFFKKCSEEFETVIYILGNHEHYHGDINESLDILKDALAHLSNVHVLEKQCVKVEDFMIFGCTLWTDMNKKDPYTLFHIRNYMNDYRTIKNKAVPVFFNGENGKKHSRPSRFLPGDSVQHHKDTLKTLKGLIAENETAKWIVAGHHAPCKLSTKPQYEHDVVVNGAYSSDLSEFILDHPQIKLWTHGHTHHEFDYMIGSTRIFCNPRGYDGYEEQSYTFKLKFIEV
jgi:hypothetical protein